MRYEVRHAIGSGGKAGKGRNRTSTIRVMDSTQRTVVRAFPTWKATAPT